MKFYISVLAISLLIACSSADKQSNAPCDFSGYNPSDFPVKNKKNDWEEFNLNGKVKSVTDFFFEYEKRNGVAIEKPRGDDPSLMTQEHNSSSVFDSAGNEIVKYMYGKYDTVDCDTCINPLVVYRYQEKIIKEYDKKGNLIQKKRFSIHDEPKLQSMNSYEYDCMNNLIEQIDRNCGPEFESGCSSSWSYEKKQEWVNTYDEKGNRIETFYHGEGDKKSGTKYTYNNLGDLVELNRYREDIYFGKQAYKYDNEKNIIEKKLYEGIEADTLVLRETIALEYDDKKNILKEGDWTYKYEYDSKGNWIKMFFFRSDLKPYFIKREIEYYE